MCCPITTKDESTARALVQWTAGPAAHYPLYYFIPSITGDGRYMIVHEELDGLVQLARLDLQTGQLDRFTNAHRTDTGWAIWCVAELGGIFNHLSALNVATGQAVWFENAAGNPSCCQLNVCDVDTLQTRKLLELPGRVPIGQSAFSPDGKLFAFIHADAEAFSAALAAKGQWHEHDAWRQTVDCTISLVDWHSGQVRTLIDLDYHVHHVIFADNDHVLINHCPDGNGMWAMHVGGDPASIRILRPANDQGRVCHQVVTEKGIYYESFGPLNGAHANWVGCYHWPEDRWTEIRLPIHDYVHTGLDPAGRLLIYETIAIPPDNAHRLDLLLDPLDESRQRLELLSQLPPCPCPGQRGHAHPFLGPDRKWLYHTRGVDGVPQLCALDISDLADRDDSLGPK